jgi:molybdopterin synthase sulfur carrier subunit
VRIKLPAALSQAGTPGLVEVEVPAHSTVASLLTGLNERVPGATKKILDDNGALYGYVNLYVNGDDVRHGAGLSTPVSEADEVLILPAISGG